MNHFGVTVILTLTADLVSRIIVSGAYLYLLYLGRNTKVGVSMHHEVMKCRVAFGGYFDLALYH